MKRTFLIVALLLATIPMNSQVLISLIFGDKLNSDKIEFGLEGGFNFSSITGMESSSSITAFNLGFYFDLKLKKPDWSIYTGVLVKSTQGLNNLTENDLEFLDVELREEEGIYRQELRGFLVPVMIKYKFNKSIYIAGGVQFGLVTKAYVEFNSDIDDIEIREKEYNRDDVNRIDVGVTGGLGYQFQKGPKWTVGAKYYYGFVDVYKSRSGTRNSSWFLELDIPVGKAKAKRKAEAEEMESLEKENLELKKRVEELENK